jgi:hypothetical protein
VTEPTATVDRRGQWLLLQPPTPEEVALHQRRDRSLRRWTIAYLLGGVILAVLLVFNAAQQFRLGEIWLGFLLAWMVVQVAVFAVHLVIGIPGLREGAHVNCAVACFMHLRQRHAEGTDHFAKAFNPEGPLDVEGVRSEDATEYMLLVHQAAEGERYLKALRQRLDELREDEVEPDA